MAASNALPTDALDESDIQDAQRLAMMEMDQAFDDLLDEGHHADAVAHAALFRSLTLFVDMFGEEVVASMMSKTVKAIRDGRYSLPPVVHH